MWITPEKQAWLKTLAVGSVVRVHHGETDCLGVVWLETASQWSIRGGPFVDLRVSKATGATGSVGNRAYISPVRPDDGPAAYDLAHRFRVESALEILGGSLDALGEADLSLLEGIASRVAQRSLSAPPSSGYLQTQP